MVVGDGAEGEGDLTPALTKVADRALKRVNGARKGAEFELDITKYLVSLGYENARRMIRTGTVRHQDEGDIDGVPFTIQAKDWTRRAPKGITEAQLIAIAHETNKQRAAKGHIVGFIVEKVARQPITHAWAHVDLYTLMRVSLGGSRPELASGGITYEQAELLVDTRVRLRFGYFMKLLSRMYPPR